MTKKLGKFLQKIGDVYKRQGTYKKKTVYDRLVIVFLWLSNRKGRFETSPYDRPQNILFLYESSLAERSRSCADSYHIHTSFQIFHIASRIVAVYLNALNNLSHHIYNFNF